MNDLEQLCQMIATRAPGTDVSVDEPLSASGGWWLDVRREGQRAVVEWRPGRGFGVSNGDGAYGEGPDAVVATASEALERIVALLGVAPKQPVLAERR